MLNSVNSPLQALMQNLELFIRILECVDCGGDLEISPGETIDCVQCKRRYEVVEEIPVFLPSELLDLQKKQIAHQQNYFNKSYSQIGEYRLENWRKSMLQRLFSSLGMKENEKDKFYADLGVGGTGYTVIEAAKLGHNTIGVDISIEGMIRAKRWASDQGVSNKCIFMVASSEKLPFKAKSFDSVSSISVLEHLFKHREAAGELCRITKDKIFMVVPNTYKRMWPFLWPFYLWADWDIGHLRHYSEEDLIEIFGEFDFVNETVFYNGHLIKFVQLFLEKLLKKRFSNDDWWKLEKMDLKNSSNMGVQLNASFRRMKSG